MSKYKLLVITMLMYNFVVAQKGKEIVDYKYSLRS